MQRVKMNLSGLALVGGILAATASAQTIEWVTRYNGPGDGYDIASVVVVDDAGNVYVAGRSGPQRDPNYAMVKYDAAGNELWSAAFPGSESFFLRINLYMAVDGLGNVYVTCASEGNETRDDYATIKYDADGNELWVRWYDGPANEDDSPCGIGLDGAGNVYVAGASMGSRSTFEYAVIKYDADGNEQWVRRYDTGSASNPANDATVDDAGNVYITGFTGSSGRTDYLTIKYDTDGNRKWVTTYDGPTGRKDQANAIAVDRAGNVYVTGESEGGDTSGDYATIKYTAAGQEVWARRYEGEGKDEANAIAVDIAGNVYVTGESHRQESEEDYLTIKYDSAGKELWSGRYNFQFNDIASDIVLDGWGHVYVTGQSWGGGGWDYATLKYDTQGNQLWVARYETSPRSWDSALAITADDSGHVYVTGYGGGGGFDFVTIKYLRGTGECSEQEKVKARCKNKRGSNQVKAKTLNGTPSSILRFCLDGDSCFFGFNNDRGKSKNIWTNVTPGEKHTVMVEWNCGASKKRSVDCPKP